MQEKNISILPPDRSINQPALEEMDGYINQALGIL